MTVTEHYIKFAKTHGHLWSISCEISITEGTTISIETFFCSTGTREEIFVSIFWRAGILTSSSSIFLENFCWEFFFLICRMVFCKVLHLVSVITCWNDCKILKIPRKIAILLRRNNENTKRFHLLICHFCTIYFGFFIGLCYMIVISWILNANICTALFFCCRPFFEPYLKQF